LRVFDFYSNLIRMLNCDKYRRMHWSCTILYRESCRTIWEPKHPEHTGYTPGALVPSLVLAGRLYRVYHGTYKVLRGWIMYRNMNITKLYQSHRAGFSGIFNQCIIFTILAFLDIISTSLFNATKITFSVHCTSFWKDQNLKYM